MLEHDDKIGVLLKWLDDNGLADDTIVIYSTDNGNEMLFWPDGGYAPFRGEKGTTWEGGVRVPMLARWPARSPRAATRMRCRATRTSFVTLAAAAGLTDIKEKLLAGTKLGDSEITYKVHLDGFNQLDVWTGQDQGVGAQGLLLLRRDRAHRDPRGQLEAAHRGQEGRQLVERAELSVGPLPVQPASWTRWRRWIPKATNGAMSDGSSSPSGCGSARRRLPSSSSISRA
jgi:arylsulfatase